MSTTMDQINHSSPGNTPEAVDSSFAEYSGRF